jgi:hypothetical protein
MRFPQSVFMDFVWLLIQNDCFPKQHYPSGLYNECNMFNVRYELLVYYLDELQRSNS